MNNVNPNEVPADAPPAPEPAASTAPPRDASPDGSAASVAAPRAGGGLTTAVAWVALVLGVAGAGSAGWLWQRLAKAQEELARRSADTRTEVVAARSLVGQLDAQVKDTTARLGVAELRLSEVVLQRSQLEELILSVSRSRDDSLVQDLESAVRLAIQQSQLTGSSQPLVSALQGAEQRIERAAQPRLNPVQRAIARDIERIRAASLVDVPALASRIDELVRAADEWPLRNAVGPARPTAGGKGVPTPAGQTKTATPKPPAAPAASVPSKTGTGAEGAAGAAATAVTTPDTTGMLEQAWSGFHVWRTWAWDHSLQLLRQGTADLVRVSRIDQPDAALLAPEQGYFLRENLKLMLLNARLGLLARQFDTARADVAKARQLLQRYFDADKSTTRLALETLDQLHADLRQETLPRPDDTLSALAVAASGR